MLAQAEGIIAAQPGGAPEGGAPGEPTGEESTVEATTEETSTEEATTEEPTAAEPAAEEETTVEETTQEPSTTEEPAAEKPAPEAEPAAEEPTAAVDPTSVLLEAEQASIAAEQALIASQIAGLVNSGSAPPAGEKRASYAYTSFLPFANTFGVYPASSVATAAATNPLLRSSKFAQALKNSQFASALNNGIATGEVSKATEPAPATEERRAVPAVSYASPFFAFPTVKSPLSNPFVFSPLSQTTVLKSQYVSAGGAEGEAEGTEVETEVTEVEGEGAEVETEAETEIERRTVTKRAPFVQPLYGAAAAPLSKSLAAAKVPAVPYTPLANPVAYSPLAAYAPLANTYYGTPASGVAQPTEEVNVESVETEEPTPVEEGLAAEQPAVESETVVAEEERRALVAHMIRSLKTRSPIYGSYGNPFTLALEEASLYNGINAKGSLAAARPTGGVEGELAAVEEELTGGEGTQEPETETESETEVEVEEPASEEPETGAEEPAGEETEGTVETEVEGESEGAIEERALRVRQLLTDSAAIIPALQDMLNQLRAQNLLSHPAGTSFPIGQSTSS